MDDYAAGLNPPPLNPEDFERWLIDIAWQAAGWELQAFIADNSDVVKAAAAVAEAALAGSVTQNDNTMFLTDAEMQQIEEALEGPGTASPRLVALLKRGLLFETH